MPAPAIGEITTIEQADGNHFFIGTGSGLFRAGIGDGRLKRWKVSVHQCMNSIIMPSQNNCL